MELTAKDPPWAAEAFRRLDEANSADPNLEQDGGASRPRELLYAERLSTWVLRLEPEASLALRLAARSQHLCRWMIPRADFPMDRAGYLRWRADLKLFHAQRTGEILSEAGAPSEVLARVRSLNLKQNLATDQECGVLEDALCLVFLEFQLADLAEKAEEEKVVNAIRKSWAKMSEQGRTRAQELRLGVKAALLLERALRPPPMAWA